MRTECRVVMSRKAPLSVQNGVCRRELWPCELIAVLYAFMPVVK